MPRIKKRTTTGRVVIIEKKKKVGYSRCASCRRILHGVPRGDVELYSKLSKSGKRPNRIYAGYYCSACSREILREKARKV
jgi:large subunit ribosomal protein L34e